MGFCAISALGACGNSEGGSGGAGANGVGAGGATSPVGGGAGASSAGRGGANGNGGSGNASGSAGVGFGGASGVGACLAPEPPLGNEDDPVAMPKSDPKLANQTHRFFKIVVRDAASNAPLEGVVVKTVNEITFVSDQNGVIAFYEPGLMGLNVFFTPSAAGYEFPADGFGIRGKALMVSEGGTGELRMNKTGTALFTKQGDLQSRLAAGNVPGRAECTAIRVFDQDNLRGVPLVELSAFGEQYWSDSQGMIAYCHPDHQGQTVSFDFFSHGYALPAGGSKVSLATSKGGTQSVKLLRVNVAERLYRLIGGGVYRDSLLLGLEVPLAQPALDGQVLGSDTASTTVYKGKIFWLWQDTNQVSYPLGNFRGTAATSLMPGQGGLSANRGVDLGYFVRENGFASEMCPGCKGAPVWIDGLASVPDANGVEQLYAGYASVDSSGASTETGLLRFNDQKQYFEPQITSFLSRDGFQRPGGHPYHFRHGEKDYVYHDARLRIGATSAAYLDPDHYQQFSPYGAAGSKTLLKNADGSLDYQWRDGARHVTSDALKSASVAASQDLDGHELDAASGQPITLTARTVTWSPYRRRFVQSAQQLYGGSSLLGEVWIAEADTPMGPFVHARKVITHSIYTFYNVLPHPELDRGQYMYIEGTYTGTYTDVERTPRYDYNQQLYRIDLEDERLISPVAIYDLGDGQLGDKAELRRGAPALSAAFLAADRPGQGLVAVAWSGAACAPDRRLIAAATPATRPLFYALPANTANPPTRTALLYEYTNAAGKRWYGTANPPAGYQRAATALARVWENPTAIKVPVADYLGEVIADAGEDQCLTAATTLTPVTLDAKASSGFSKVRWHLPGCDVEGAQVTVRLPKGTHSIELEVTDAYGHAARDQLIVSIQ